MGTEFANARNKGTRCEFSVFAVSVFAFQLGAGL
jgi:hypothetical protein